MIHIPYIIEKNGRNEKPLDIFSRLLMDRIVYFSGVVTPETADIVIMQLLWLKADKPDEDIYLYIKSPGGSVYDGLAIKNAIDKVSDENCKVHTIGMGMIASMGSYLLSAGTGTRKATSDCRIMIHSVSSGTQGTFHDMEIDQKETAYLQKKLVQQLADFTNGKTSYKKMWNLTKRDKYLSPEEAINLGLIDEVI